MKECFFKAALVLAIVAMPVRLALASPDDGLYDPLPPEGSAFVRFVGDMKGLDSSEAKLNDRTVDWVEYKEVSTYFVAEEGKVDVSVGENISHNFDAEAGNFYSVIIGDNGKVSVNKDPISENQAKSQIILYNLTADNKVSLKTSDGKIDIVDPLEIGGVSGREINPVKLSLAVYKNGEELTKINNVSLDRGRTYSVMVMNDSQIDVFESHTNTTR